MVISCKEEYVAKTHVKTPLTLQRQQAASLEICRTLLLTSDFLAHLSCKATFHCLVSRPDQCVGFI